MDITAFITSQRDNAALLGGYDQYHIRLSRRIATVRRKLGRASERNAKQSADKASVTAEDIRTNKEFVHLLLLTAERAWAHGMQERSAHGEDVGKKITGATRRHIISRLRKASKHADELVALLSEQETTGAGDVDVLEAQAYASMLAGAAEFEKQSGAPRSEDVGQRKKQWELCLQLYSAARVMHDALLRGTKKDLFKEVIASNIDPSIRYAAYQSQLPRSLGHTELSMRYFPRSKESLVTVLEKVDPDALRPEAKSTAKSSRPENIPSSVQWRSRSANVSDASIGQALASVSTAESVLTSYLSSSGRDATAKDKAAAYDNVLIASQDAADATRRAIDEMEKEMVDEGDSRMQDLRVTSLAVNYALVGWRVGRNRILMGDDDGASLTTEKVKQMKKSRKKETQQREKDESKGRKLARLRERIALYDAILQSIDSVKELRGAMRDTAFIEELEAKRAYFRALKCLNIGYSHSIVLSTREALALFTHARTFSFKALSNPSALTNPADEESKPPTLDVTSTQAQKLDNRLSALITHNHALCELRELTQQAAAEAEREGKARVPLVEQLHEYPMYEVDLTNLVTYPPKIEPVPLKPIFLDLAYNYIRYPGEPGPADGGGEVKQTQETQPAAQEKKEPAKRGWFGFGRS